MMVIGSRDISAVGISLLELPGGQRYTRWGCIPMPPHD